MFIRDYLLIDTEDGEDILDLQSEKGGAQRTGVCRKLRMPKSALLRGFVLVRPEPFNMQTRHVSGTFDVNIFDYEFYYILLLKE